MKTMTGITWGEDRIYRVVTRDFPEDGDELKQGPTNLDMGIPTTTVPVPGSAKPDEPERSKSQLAALEV